MKKAASWGGLKQWCLAYRLPPTAMATSSPTVVVTATAASHVVAAMSVTSTSKNNLAIRTRDQRVRRSQRHCRSGQDRHSRECTGGDAYQQ
jgi:hypothetical protein